jgi:predicted nucleic acid-binding protein
VKPIVIDSTAAGAWVLPDEPNDATQELYLQAIETSDLFHAPLLWHWEVGNMLVMASMRQRLEPDQVDAGLELLGAAKINFDAPPSLHRQAQIARLARTHALTCYDAAYLELVLRLNGHLATLDKQLVAAAKSCGIACLSF